MLHGECVVCCLLWCDIMWWVKHGICDIYDCAKCVLYAIYIYMCCMVCVIGCVLCVVSCAGCEWWLVRARSWLFACWSFASWYHIRSHQDGYPLVTEHTHGGPLCDHDMITYSFILS